MFSCVNKGQVDRLRFTGTAKNISKLISDFACSQILSVADAYASSLHYVFCLLLYFYTIPIYFFCCWLPFLFFSLFSLPLTCAVWDCCRSLSCFQLFYIIWLRAFVSRTIHCCSPSLWYKVSQCVSLYLFISSSFFFFLLFYSLPLLLVVAIAHHELDAAIHSFHGSYMCSGISANPFPCRFSPFLFLHWPTIWH